MAAMYAEQSHPEARYRCGPPSDDVFANLAAGVSNALYPVYAIIGLLLLVIIFGYHRHIENGCDQHPKGSDASAAERRGTFPTGESH